MRFTKSYLYILLLSFLTCSLFSQVKNIGLPEIRNYKRTDYKGGTQNWNIDQDKNGNMYFANNTGLLQFDGSTWTKYNLPTSSDIRCLKIDASGKIFVGGYNEFGYFKANSKGKLEYSSIRKLLIRDRNEIIDNIWKINLYKDEVHFQAFENTYIFKNNKLKVLAPPSRFQFSFKVNNHLYFQDVSNGLMEYIDGILYPLKGTSLLNNTEVWGMFPISDNKTVIATIDKGLFIYENEKLAPWNTEANEFLKKNSCLGGGLMKDNSIVLNSVLDGIIVCDISGKIMQHINRKKGLQNNTVLSSFIDGKNNLWLGLDNGIAFVNESSPFSYFGFSFDLSTVYATVIHKGNLYVATNQGLFYRPWKGPYKEDVFNLVAGTTGQAWNIQVIDNQLICAHNRGALLIEGDKSIKTLDHEGHWSFKKIPNRPNYMIGSNYKGFSLFEKKQNRWEYKNQIEGYSTSVGAFEIDNDNIWVKKDNLIYQMVLSNDLQKFQFVKTFQNLSNSIKGIGSIQKIKKNIYFQTSNHFFKYSKNNDSFYEDKKMSTLFKNIPKVNTIQEDQYGNIWYVFNQSLGALMKTGPNTYKNSIAPFSNFTGNLVYNYFSINTVDPKNIFIGLTEGLAHYDSQLLKNFESKPKAFIRSFSFKGETILYGNGPSTTTKYKIPYNSNNVKFTFSSPSYENAENIKYSYQLEGFDDKWSNWAAVSMKEYTNLREGKYTMKLRVKNSYGIESDQMAIPFSISPPWYRHFLAFYLYIIAITTAFYFIRKRIKAKIRKNKYYETLEQRRLYLEKESKIKQEQYELEKEIERLKSDKLQIKILSKDKELVNNSLQVVKKNKLLNGIIHKLKDINIESFDESTKFQFSKLNKSIIKEVNVDKSWKDLEKHIKSVHFDFLKRLKEKYPLISPREMDLSTYLLMNMSTKEIAEIMNISNGGVELARYRLRKKLDLTKKENLVGFLMSI